jgi:transcriptional regulator with XRE-family HTH domain
MQKLYKPNCYRGLLVTADSSALYAWGVFHRGDILRKWRESRELTAQQLADKAGVNKNVVTRAEKGQGLREDSLRAILKALSRSVSDLEAAVERYSSDPISADDRAVLRVLETQAELRSWLLGMRDPAEVSTAGSDPVHQVAGGGKRRTPHRARPGGGGKRP